MLLPHVLSRVPLRQLLWLQRVSRAFRALVQLHLARLRRFDAAQVSLGLEPRPLLDTAHPPRHFCPASSPQSLCLPFRIARGPLGMPRKRSTQREVLSKGEYQGST